MPEYPPASQTVDPNLELFQQLDAINGKMLDENLRGSLAGQQQLYSIVPDTEKEKVLAHYLDQQIERYLDTAIYRSGNASQTVRAAEAEKGLALLAERITDPKQRAAFLEKTFTMASRAQGNCGTHVVPFAAQLLATPGIDEHLTVLAHGEAPHARVSFGAEVIRHMHQEKTLADTNKVSPLAVQLAVNSALWSARKSDHVITDSLRAQQTVAALEAPQIEENIARKYEAIGDNNRENTEYAWTRKATLIRESKTPVDDVLAMDKAGLALDAQITGALGSSVCQELWNGDRTHDGALAAMVELQKNDKHTFFRRAEDWILIALNQFPHIYESNRGGKYFVIRNYFAKIKEALHELPEPQVAEKHDAIGRNVWQKIAREHEDEEFQEQLGGFTYRLGVSPNPVHGAENNPALARLNEEQREVFTTQFHDFYIDADPNTRRFVQGCAYDDIDAEGQTPQQAAVCHMTVDGARHKFRQNTFWSKPVVWLADTLGGKPLYQQAFAEINQKTNNKTRSPHPPYLASPLLNS